MEKAALNQLHDYPCPHCKYVRHVSVEGERATVVLPRTCPMRHTCEREVLRAYYLTMGDPKR